MLPLLITITSSIPLKKIIRIYLEEIMMQSL